MSKCYEGNVQLKKYHIREINGSILVWYDSRDDHQDPDYEPFKFEHDLQYRGESINHVNCHVQEIPENGADIRHFDFLHTKAIDCIDFIRFEWSMLSHRASEKDLFDVMKHKREFINDYKMKILNRYITEENKNYLNIISLDAYIKIFNYKFFFFNGTGFQVGPGLVYLFLKSRFFEVTFAQSVTPLDKFHIKVSHRIFTSWFLPYWISAFMLYSEVKQVFNDMRIWNGKTFGSKLAYNLKADADKNLHSWRNWFAQFYEGCYEFEKKISQYDW